MERLARRRDGPAYFSILLARSTAPSAVARRRRVEERAERNLERVSDPERGAERDRAATVLERLEILGEHARARRSDRLGEPTFAPQLGDATPQIVEHLSECLTHRRGMRPNVVPQYLKIIRCYCTGAARTPRRDAVARRR